MPVQAITPTTYGESKKFYDSRYANAYMDDWEQKKKQRVIDILKKLNLPKKGQALDFGCGNGVWTNLLKDVLPQWKVYGTDISTVAIKNAQNRYTNLNFFGLQELTSYKENFDLVFSHHVLEHVLNIEETWHLLSIACKQNATMVHILPCGNKGSLEYQTAVLVKDGIDQKTGRFFFEDSDHLRRLTSEQMRILGEKNGFIIIDSHYSQHYWSALESICHNGIKLTLKLTDHKRAINREAAKELKQLRLKLLPFSLFTPPAFLFKRRNRIKAYYSLTIAFPATIALTAAYPLSRLIDRQLTRNADQEWIMQNKKENGGEMYLVFKAAEPN
jgi:SAM-dependent methyltransferase